MEGQFTLKQHHRFIALVIETARRHGKNTVRVSLNQTAQIYDFTNLLRDEEEMEFVLDDITMELSEMMLVAADNTKIESCGIERIDYPGGRADLEVRIAPELKTIKEFRLQDPE